MAVHLYLSPHLDDAVISCGGLIVQQTSEGDEVVVLTAFAGDRPPGPLSAIGRELHLRWGVGDAPVVVRRAEDRAACRCLSAAVVHHEIPDAIYRRGPYGKWLYPSEEDLLGACHPSEEGLLNEVAHLIEQAATPDARIYCPSAFGGHVDHRLVRRAAEGLERPLWFYRDLPYAARGGSVPHDLPLPPGVEVIHPISDAETESWAAAVAEYQSQLSSFWPDPGSIFVELRAYHDRHGGIPLLHWGLPASDAGEPV